MRWQQHATSIVQHCGFTKRLPLGWHSVEHQPNNKRARIQWVRHALQWLSIVSPIPTAIPPLVHIRIMAASSGVAMVHHYTAQLILRSPTIRTGVQGAEPGHVQPVAILHWRVDPGIYVILQPPPKVTGLE